MTRNSIAPRVSVILPVYNAEEYIREAVESILAQTFSDFELIIINDGSSDGSDRIIRSITDPRIVYHSQQNSGLAATLNRGIEMARGQLIARQDNDDVSLPSRLEKQVNFMQKHPEVGLLGTGAVIVDRHGKPTGRFHDHPQSNSSLQFHLLFNNPFVHSSVIFRRSVIDSVGSYSTDTAHFEDHNLWSRMARVTQVANLPERLLQYREVAGGMSRTTTDYRLRVRAQAVNNLMALGSVNREDCELMVDLVHGTYFAASDYFRWKKFIRQNLKCIEQALAGRLGVTADSLRTESDRVIQAFQRHYYNQVIRSSEASAFRKFWAFAMRRFMYHRYPALFGRS